MLAAWTARADESKAASLLRFLECCSAAGVEFYLPERSFIAIRAAFLAAEAAVEHRRRVKDWSVRYRANVGPATPALQDEAWEIDMAIARALDEFKRDTE